MNDNLIMFGSDLIVDILNRSGIKYAAYNPGATIRGMEHSMQLRYDTSDDGGLILCCHEEIAIAAAHGYAKATNSCMAVLLHSNVGLLHAGMAIFNAWCDRVPMLIIGGCGPMDTELRRPWIDWIHTSQNQSSIVNDFVKWHDQPQSLQSIPESLCRAIKVANTEPKAPVYIAVDSKLQETAIKETVHSVNQSKYLPPKTPQADSDTLEKIADSLVNADFPVIIADYMGRNPDAVENLVSLAELIASPVIDKGGRYNFPSDNQLNCVGAEKEILGSADLILALDVNDLYGALGCLDKNGAYKSFLEKKAKIISVTLSDYLISKWSADYQRLYPVDMLVAADSGHVLSELFRICNSKIKCLNKNYQKRFEAVIEISDNRNKFMNHAIEVSNKTPIPVSSALYGIWEAIKSENFVLVNPGSFSESFWIYRLWKFNKVGSHIGSSGGAGLGYGIGASIGAALAYRNTNKICVDIQSDGDLLYSPGALWTAAHYKLPLLIIVMNNRGYGNTRTHALKIAKLRKQKADISGSLIRNPDIDFIEMAHSFGVKTAGRVDTIDSIFSAVVKAVKMINENPQPVLIEINTGDSF